MANTKTGINWTDKTWNPVPFFFKQWGGRTPKAKGRIYQGKTWDAMPQKYLSNTNTTH